MSEYPGPIWDIFFDKLSDPTVTELQMNSPEAVFIKVDGRREKIDVYGATDEEYMYGLKEYVARCIDSPYEFDEEGYLFEGPIKYGNMVGRATIILPPTTKHPQVNVAKKSVTLATVDSIAARGSMSAEMLLFLKTIMRLKMSIVVSGSTGSGKTTLLESLTKIINYNERIGVAEDTPELKLIQDNVAYLNSVPWKPMFNPNDVATLSWVIAQFQRLRVDRIIVGETRGKEFNDWLTAANSGMEGSMTTIHANNPVKCLDKMSNFALLARPGQSPRNVNYDIASAVDIIIQLNILPNGKHKVTEILEVTETLSNNDDARIATNPLYRYDPIEDNFVKVNQPSEAIRRKFTASNINSRDLFATPIGGRMLPHTPTGNEGNPQEVIRSNGLPIPSKYRSL